MEGSMGTYRGEQQYFVPDSNKKREQQDSIVSVDSVPSRYSVESLAELAVGAVRKGRGLREEWTRFANTLLRVVYNGEGSLERLSRDIRVEIASMPGVDPEQKRQAEKEIDDLARGIRSVMKYLHERNSVDLQPGQRLHFGLNDRLDAGSEIDIIESVIDSEGTVDEVRLVQIKSNDNRQKDTTQQSHQEYLDSLLSPAEVVGRREQKAIEGSVDSDVEMYVRREDTREQYAARIDAYQEIITEFLVRITDSKRNKPLTDVDVEKIFSRDGKKMAQAAFLCRSSGLEGFLSMLLEMVSDDPIEQRDLSRAFHELVIPWAREYKPDPRAVLELSDGIDLNVPGLLNGAKKFTSVTWSPAKGEKTQQLISPVVRRGVRA